MSNYELIKFILEYNEFDTISESKPMATFQRHDMFASYDFDKDIFCLTVDDNDHVLIGDQITEMEIENLIYCYE